MPNEVTNLCGPIISQIRNLANPAITQEELTAKLQAKGLDIDRATLAKIETQRRRVFDYEVIVLAEVLKTTPSILLGYE